MVRFKSVPAMFYKEKSGKKPNTLRKKDLADERFIQLGAMAAVYEYGTIEITNTATGECFRREITDVTTWEDWVIISWKHYESKFKGGR